jgi:hypothetical protein
MDEKAWNETERSKAERVCKAFEDIIDRDGDSDDDFEEDTRTPEDADAILDEVVRLN